MTLWDYLLNLLKPLGLKVGLYRDDGLALSDGNGPETERLKKEITKIFKENGLGITTSTNVKIVNFLDVTLNLNNGSYKPPSNRICQRERKTLYEQKPKIEENTRSVNPHFLRRIKEQTLPPGE